MTLINHTRAAVSLLALALAGTSLRADSNWTRFRGPNGSGLAVSAKPPITWSDSQGVKWKAALPGPGTSSPILVGERIFVTSFSGYGDGGNGGPADLKRHLVCLDQKTGKILWSRTVATEQSEDRYEGFLAEHGYASHTPASDGNQVYVYFSKSGALAFDLNGKELWRTNLGKGSNFKNWGSASSPVLHKELVIINASEESHAIYGLDRKTGRQVWKAEADTLENTFGSPALVESEGRTDLVFAVPGELWGMNPDTGKLRWYAESGLPQNIAPSVVVGEGVVYAFGGFPQLGAVAVRTGGKGDVTKTHVLWSSRNSSYVPTPVLHEGRLYFASDQGFAMCLDAKTGDLVYKERLPGASASGRGGKPFYASPVLANGRLYVVSRRNGSFVIEAKPEFKLVAHNLLAADTSQFNATPAVSGTKLFLRSDRYIYCIDADSQQ